MPAQGFCSLTKGEVMMCLALADLKRSAAAKLGGVSERTFRRHMRKYRVSAPKSNAKLTAAGAAEVRMLLGKHTQKQVAKLKGVHWRTVQQVGSYQTWYRNI